MRICVGVCIIVFLKEQSIKIYNICDLTCVFNCSVACDYAGTNIAFHVDQGSNSNYIAFVVEFEEGDGDISGVGLMETTSSSKTSSTNGQVITTEWRGMQQSWGAVWKLDAGGELKPPLSIQITSQYTGQTLVAKNVIPVGWKPGATYRSLVNFL